MTLGRVSERNRPRADGQLVAVGVLPRSKRRQAPQPSVGFCQGWSLLFSQLPSLIQGVTSPGAFLLLLLLPSDSAGTPRQQAHGTGRQMRWAVCRALGSSCPDLKALPGSYVGGRSWLL